MKDIKSITIFLIPYFTICGGIYHITYWDTFNINGLSYLGVSEILKSFIYPFIGSVFIFLLNHILLNSFYNYNNLLPNGEGRNSTIGKKLNSKISINILLLLWVGITIYLYKVCKTYDWLYFGIYFSFTTSIIIERIAEANNYIEKHTSLIIKILVYIPVFSFVAGKYQSELIQNNIKYQYTINQQIIPNNKLEKIDTLKLIGNSEKQYFFTDLNNSTIYILRSDIIDTLVIKQHGYK
ncbi:hypothetical protein [Flavobacterium sp. N3904]|uniref:hypothetical protein n=1 Tax=Flavobacterium sp. N3904 TaxID=2986835 RepID=UPI002224B086|nr:hypothetical protein [Flavobacterium sp. N3904]